MLDIRYAHYLLCIWILHIFSQYVLAYSHMLLVLDVIIFVEGPSFFFHLNLWMLNAESLQANTHLLFSCVRCAHCQ